MHDILTAAALERRKKGGRRPALSPGDQLFLTLQYWREYRTMKHLAFDFGISKSTVSDNTAAQRIGNDIETSTLFLPYFPEQNNLSSSEMFLNNLGIQLSPVVFTLKIGGYGGYPRSVMDLEKQFSTEDACKDYLFRLRWPNGFVCPLWQAKSNWKATRGRFVCCECQHQTTVTAGTIFHNTRKPLTMWFRAAWTSNETNSRH